MIDYIINNNFFVQPKVFVPTPNNIQDDNPAPVYPNNYQGLNPQSDFSKPV